MRYDLHLCTDARIREPYALNALSRFSSAETKCNNNRHIILFVDYNLDDLFLARIPNLVSYLQCQICRSFYKFHI